MSSFHHKTLFPGEPTFRLHVGSGMTDARYFGLALGSILFGMLALNAFLG
jgi:hypothetical protein